MSRSASRRKQTHPYPIIMVHGGTMSGTNYTGTPDGREGWAQYFVRQGYAVYVVDQPGRGRSGFLTAATGPMQNFATRQSASRFVAQEKFKLWPQAELHTQWPGNGEPDDPATLQLAMSQLPAIEDFDKQQPIDARRADRAARQDRAVDPDDPFAGRRVRLAGGGCAARSGQGDPGDRAERPARSAALEFVGAPDWFKEGRSRCPTASRRCRSPMRRR